MKTTKIHRRQRKDLFKWLSRKMVVMFTLYFFLAGTALANPYGAQVVNGNVNFHTQGNTLNITNSPNSIINWQGFSIKPNEITRFIQQSPTSAILNRIVGQNPSAILGTLQSNGRVFLINPNGVLFGQGARIEVNGLTASTLNLTNQDFLSGRYNFTAGSNPGSIKNQGIITTPAGGQVYLIAPDIENTGIINSPQGDVMLAAGHRVQLIDSADPFISVVVSAPIDRALNLGKIVAASGRIGIYGGLIRQGGIVNADSAVVGDGGKIIFKATKKLSLDEGSVTSANGLKGGDIKIESEGGKTEISGLVTAAGSDAKGGDIQVLGNDVVLTGEALIDASGKNGGGKVLVGGDFQGQNPSVPNAQTTSVGEYVVIKADALENGNGGEVAIWANDKTTFNGSISARGGNMGGNGGRVETSGHQLSIGSSARVNTSASRGESGSWLLDPNDFTIAASGGDMDGYTLGFNLATTDVTILSSVGTGGVNGDIIVNDAVNWASNHVLTLKAYHDIIINQLVTNPETIGKLVLRADSTGTGSGTVLFGETGGVSLPYGSVYIFYNPSDYANPTNFSGHVVSGGTPLAAFMLVNDVFKLQDISSNLSGSYALGKNIDASATSGWNSGAGFVPIGNGPVSEIAGPDPFTGTFNGNGYTITGLFINRPAADYVGLFGYHGNVVATIKDVQLIDVNITGHSNVGALVGYNMGAVTNSSVTGTVTGTGDNVGGLVGYNCMPGSVSASYSLAAVSGNNYVGGLVGYNGLSAIIVNSDSTGAVTGVSYVGGLAGANEGDIINSYSAGAVTGGSFTGGLVGDNSGTVTNSFWDMETSGMTVSAGGTGKTSAEMTQKTTFTDAGWDFGPGGTWTITEGVSYPGLKGQSSSPPKFILLFTADKLTKTYGDANYFSATITGYVGGDSAATAFTGLPAYSLFSENAGTWTITVSQGTLASAKYKFTFAGGLMTINKALLTITAPTNTKIYDGTTTVAAAPIISGLRFDDTVTDLTAVYADKNAGTGKTISVTGYTVNDGNGGSNYSVTTINNNAGVINKAALTIAPTTYTKRYDGTTAVDLEKASPTSTGLQAGDTITGLTEAYTDKNAGTNKTIRLGSGFVVNDGNGGNNYNVTTINETTGVINKASLTIIADDKTKIYGDANPAFTGAISGFVNGETLATSGVTGSANFTTSATAASNAGNYNITPDAGTLAANNYSFNSLINGNLQINKAPLTVTADDMTKFFGDPNPAFTASYSGFKLSQNQTVLGGSLSFDTPATPISPVGDYRIKPGGLTSSNYQIAFVDGTLTVVQPLQQSTQQQQNALIVSVNNANGTVTQTTLSLDQSGGGSEGGKDKDKEPDNKGGQSTSKEGQDSGTKRQALPYCN